MTSVYLIFFAFLVGVSAVADETPADAGSVDVVDYMGRAPTVFSITAKASTLKKALKSISSEGKTTCQLKIQDGKFVQLNVPARADAPMCKLILSDNECKEIRAGTDPDVTLGFGTVKKEKKGQDDWYFFDTGLKALVCAPPSGRKLPLRDLATIFGELGKVEFVQRFGARSKPRLESWPPRESRNAGAVEERSERKPGNPQ